MGADCQFIVKLVSLEKLLACVINPILELSNNWFMN